MSIPGYLVAPSNRSDQDPSNPSPLKTLDQAVCRILDFTLALIALVLLSPLFLILAFLIRLDSRGPVFFGQIRVGYNGREFRCYKFRSMCVDAEHVREQLLHANEASGPLFKMKNDPRITRVGYWMRRCSADELPQLFNILRGEMSLVGPRPALPKEVATYDAKQRGRLKAVPGLTGLAQVSGRSDLDFDSAINLDLDYVARRSVWFNIVIMLKTIPAIISTRGAY